MKLRKVLSLIMAIAMIMTASTAFAFSDVTVEDDAYEAITGLSALNILTGYEDGTFLPEGKITRAEFATIVMRTLGMDVNSKVNTVFEDVTSEHWASGAISEAYGAGIVNGRTATTFDPEAEVTYEEAVKMLVCAMGYQKKAESLVKEGQNPFPTAYNLIANQKGITAGVEKTAGGASRATVAKLVWNALPVELMDQTSYGSEVSFEEIEDQSLLYKNLNAVLMEAKIDEISLDKTVTDVSFVASTIELDDVAAVNYTNKSGDVVVSSFVKFDKGACDLAGLQGLTVKALVDISDSKEPVLIAVFPAASNKTLEIDPKLYAGIEGNKIKYYTSATSNTVNTSSRIETKTVKDEDKDKDVTLPNVAIYTNLVKCNDAIDVVTDLSNNPGNALYRFVDTDNDGYYDTLFVDNYASFVVGTVDVEGYNIMANTSDSVYSSDTTFNSMESYDYDLTLDPEDETVTWSLKDDAGNDIEISDINVGDVITYAMSTDGTNYYYDITVCKSTAVTGTISSVGTQKRRNANVTDYYYEIDGNVYFLNVSDTTDGDSKLEAGESGTFQITADGKIIAVQLDATARNFAAAIKVAESSTGFDDSLKIQLMTANGAVETLSFYETFTISGTVSADQDSIDVAKINAAITGQPVMYELRSDGTIKNLYYGDAISTGSKKDYKVVTISEEEYKESSNKIGSTYLDDSTAVVAIEDNSNIDDDKAIVKKEFSLISSTSFVDENKYSGKAVVDSNKNAVFVVVDDFIVLPGYDLAPMYVTGISTVSVDGTRRKQITGLVGKDEVSYPFAEEVTMVYMDDAKVKADSKVASLYTASKAEDEVKVGDAIQFTLNGAEEINAFRHLVKVNGTTANFLVASDITKNEDAKDVYGQVEGKDVAYAANLVSYSLADFKTIDKVPTLPVKGTATTMRGYGAFGRVQRVSGSTVGIFYAYGEKDSENEFESYYDVTADSSLPLYVVNGSYAEGYDVKSLSSIRTFISTGKKLDKTDDVIYIYKYDDEAVFQYAIDSLQDNK